MLVLALSLAHAQTVINGDFEDTTATGCMYNVPNSQIPSYLPGVTAFGGTLIATGEVDVQTFGCYVDPFEGDWCVGLASAGQGDKISLPFDAPLTPGLAYAVSFSVYGNASFSSGVLDAAIGVSDSSTSLGTTIGLARTTPSRWTSHVFEFTAGPGANYVTVHASGVADPSWLSIDNIEITPLCDDDDADGICNDDDWCFGDQAYGDRDGDGTCDDLDFVLDTTPLVAGSTLRLRAYNAPPNTAVLFYATGRGWGSAPCTAQGVCGDLANPVLLRATTSDAFGEAYATINVPATVGNLSQVLFQATWEGLTSSEVSNTVVRRPR